MNLLDLFLFSRESSFKDILLPTKKLQVKTDWQCRSTTYWTCREIISSNPKKYWRRSCHQIRMEPFVKTEGILKFSIFSKAKLKLKWWIRSPFDLQQMQWCIWIRISNSLEQGILQDYRFFFLYFFRCFFSNIGLEFNFLIHEKICGKILGENSVKAKRF